MDYNNSMGGCVPSEGEMIYPSLSFRYLSPFEVEVRPAEVKNNRVILLLYQDARCAMNILDQTVTPFGWQKEYYEENGLLFCRLGIKDPTTHEWCWKSDVGTPGKIEADKAHASDAFKRSAVSWGIGRELYTAPRIVVNLTDKDMHNGNLSQTFHVGTMEVKDGSITALTILDKWNNVRFTYSAEDGAKTADPITPIAPVVEDLPGFEDIPDFEGGSATTSCDVAKKTGTELITEFCNKMKDQPGVDQFQLKRFYDFFTKKPSRKDPSICIVDSYEVVNPDMLWKNWLGNVRS